MLALGVAGLTAGTAGAGTVLGRTEHRPEADSNDVAPTNSSAPTPTVGFQQSYTPTQGYSAGWSVVPALDGEYVTAGYTTQGTTATGFAVYLLKVRADGTQEWIREYDLLGDGADVEWSEAGAEFFISLAQTDEGYALAGPQFNATNRRAWLLKTTADGTPEWTRTYGGPDGYRLAYGMTPAADGETGFVLTGTWDAPGYTPSGVWFLRTDADGTPVVERTYGDGVCGAVEGTAFDVTPFYDGYALTGQFYDGQNQGSGAIRVDADGTIRWSRVLTSDAVAFAGASADGSDDLWVASSAVFTAGSPAMTLTTLDATGTVTGDYSLGTGIAYDALTDGGGVTLVGNNADPTVHGFASAIAEDGSQRWRLPFEPVVLRGIAQTTGGYVVVGDPPDQAIGDGPLLARIDV